MLRWGAAETTGASGKNYLTAVAAAYGLGGLLGSCGIRGGTVNTSYALDLEGGRFTGACLVNGLVLSSIPLGLAFGSLMPYLDRERFGVRRTDERFWSYSDRAHAAFSELEPIESGLFDYNRLDGR